MTQSRQTLGEFSSCFITGLWCAEPGAAATATAAAALPAPFADVSIGRELPQAPATTGVLFSCAGPPEVSGWKSVDCKDTGGCADVGCLGEPSFGIGELCPFDRGGEMGDIVREPVCERSWWRAPASVGCAFRPTAQSGRAGNGCCDDVVDVNVRREEEDVVDDDCRMIIN